MKTLRRPLGVYLSVGTSASLLYCLWGQGGNWTPVPNALVNVAFGLYILEVVTILPAAAVASLILRPAFVNGRVQPERKQVIAFTTVGLFLQALLMFLAFLGVLGELST